MTESYSWKQEGKPNLFTWNLDKVRKDIEENYDSNTTHRKYIDIMFRFDELYFSIIKDQVFDESSIDEMFEIIQSNENIVINHVGTKIQNLSKWSSYVKEKIVSLIYSSNVKTKEFGLILLSSAFHDEELSEIFNISIGTGSLTLKSRVIDIAYRLKKKDYLENLLKIEVDEKIKKDIMNLLRMMN